MFQLVLGAFPKAIWSRDSSVDTSLDGRAFMSRFSAVATDCYLFQNVQAGSGVHPAFCSVGAGCLSPGVKRSLSPNTEIKNMWRYTSVATCSFVPIA